MSRSYLEFRFSELGDSSWRRTLSTLSLNEYKDLVVKYEVKIPENDKSQWLLQVLQVADFLHGLQLA